MDLALKARRRHCLQLALDLNAHRPTILFANDSRGDEALLLISEP